MEHAIRDELEAGGVERGLFLVLLNREELEDCVRVENRVEAAQRLSSTARQPQLRWVDLATGAEETAESPGDDVAPVVEVEVGDDDRVHARPLLEPAQARQHAGAAVE